jgi:hypothetical protein
LDNYDARILLRSEFNALRNCLGAIRKNSELGAQQFLSDALYFRKMREEKFAKYNHLALELETLEGLATYTGYKLSAHKDLLQAATKELNGREQPTGLNRSFAYATGLAYGVIFDHFQIKWRTDLKHVYSFLNIYEKNISTIRLSKVKFKEVKQRNKYYSVEQEETARKVTIEGYHEFYTKTFLTNPVLVIKIDTSNKTPLTLSYDMNSTFSLGSRGIVYAAIPGGTSDSTMFGSFKTTGETSIGKTGVLITSKFDKLTFPKPLKVEDNTITGENYIIQLNNGWKVKLVDKKGNAEIVKE